MKERASPQTGRDAVKIGGPDNPGLLSSCADDPRSRQAKQQQPTQGNSR